MVIEQLTLWNFGALERYEAVLLPTLNVLKTREPDSLAAALSFLLCSQTGSPPGDSRVRPDTRLSARVRLGTVTCQTAAVCRNGKLVLRVTDPAGQDITEHYRQLLTHCAEQDAIEHFDGMDKGTPDRLCRYRSTRDRNADRDLPHRTDRIADTKAFRAQLVRYIQSFQPEPIHSRKPYFTGITPHGQFTVCHPEISQGIHLSESEEKLFRYICFLNTAAFWEEVEQNRDLHYERKPLIVRNFLEYLDESTCLDRLTDRTLRLRRQVLMLTRTPGL